MNSCRRLANRPQHPLFQRIKENEPVQPNLRPRKENRAGNGLSQKRHTVFRVLVTVRRLLLKSSVKGSDIRQFLLEIPRPHGFRRFSQGRRRPAVTFQLFDGIRQRCRKASLLRRPRQHRKISCPFCNNLFQDQALPYRREPWPRRSPHLLAQPPSQPPKPKDMAPHRPPARRPRR